MYIHSLSLTKPETYEVFCPTTILISTKTLTRGPTLHYLLKHATHTTILIVCRRVADLHTPLWPARLCGGGVVVSLSPPPMEGDWLEEGDLLLIFWWFSSSALATALAGMSHLNTWHLCFFVTWSRATYPNSLYTQSIVHHTQTKDRPFYTYKNIVLLIYFNKYIYMYMYWLIWRWLKMKMIWRWLKWSSYL